MASATKQRYAVKREVELTFDASTLHCLFTTALEGGIGYWSGASRYHWCHRDGEGYVDDLEGFEAMLVPTEDDTWGEELGAELMAKLHARGVVVDGQLRVDRNVMLAGIELALGEHSHSFWAALMACGLGVEAMTDDMLGEIDAGDCDTIVQLGLFGQVVYG